MPSRPHFQPPKRWTTTQLKADLARSAEDFRRERLEEPLEAYTESFEIARDSFEDLLEETIDLSLLESAASQLLSDQVKLDNLRYLAGPPISLDDLRTLSDAKSLSAGKLRNDPQLVKRLVGTIRAGLDRNRFPWVSENREPTKEERRAAIVASAALMAAQHTATARRNEG